MKTKSLWVSWHLASALLALPLLGMTVPAFAAAPPATDSVTVISNPAAVAVAAAALGIPTMYDGGTLTGITEVTNSAAVVPNGVSSGPQPDWPWQSPEVRDVQLTGIVSNTGDVLATATGTGPKTMTISHTWTLDNSWHASVSVSASIVSGAVGFHVNGSESSTASATQQVPTGQTQTLVAYPEYAVYSFDVYYPDVLSGYHFAGTGTAEKFTGVDFVVYTG